MTGDTIRGFRRKALSLIFNSIQMLRMIHSRMCDVSQGIPYISRDISVTLDMNFHDGSWARVAKSSDSNRKYTMNFQQILFKQQYGSTLCASYIHTVVMD
ncbi:hypothetical protein BDV25DRAFT_155598 [Aspergillus avenaceus]|uniref:Uncharacterized protein n=1 Tax=Aspergillus avenaceus TaxID=36643 RepID=A0A5N6TU59_ASPAV|nr:hypothetical protein BDV25DRAFT_155598 [Aspergillus avenaceus]